MTESLLGIQLEAGSLRFSPVPHPDWSSYSIRYRYRSATYHIVVRGSDAHTVVLDGQDQPGLRVRLVDDNHDHHVAVTFQVPRS
jgi:cellobiose phosphorylase